MKQLIINLVAAAVIVAGAFGQTTKGITVGTDGQVVAPTNLWTANALNIANALNANASVFLSKSLALYDSEFDETPALRFFDGGVFMLPEYAPGFRDELGLGDAATSATGETGLAVLQADSYEEFWAAIGANWTDNEGPGMQSGPSAPGNFLTRWTASGAGPGDGEFDFVPASQYALSSLSISTTAPLSGGGNLTANRTLTVSAATTSATGVSELATDAETQTGTDTGRTITPSALAAWWTWVKTQAQTIGGSWIFSNDLTVQNNLTAGDAPGDNHTIRGNVRGQDQTSANADSYMTRQLVESDAARIPDSLTLIDRCIGGTVSSGNVGQLGWSFSGTSTTVLLSASIQLQSQFPMVAAANSGFLHLAQLGYNPPGGIYSRSTGRTFTMRGKFFPANFMTAGKPVSWSFSFANHSGGNPPTRIIPANAAGIAAIDPEDRTWSASAAFAVGDTTAPVAPNGFRYICTTAGTTAASEPTWPTTFASTVTSGGAVFTCLGRAGQATFIFFVTGADPLVNITVASSTVNIPTTSAQVAYELSIRATASGYAFSVNGETEVAIADTTTLVGSPLIGTRSDASPSAGGTYIQMSEFRFFGITRFP